jgi:hypothetical protein
MMKTCIVAIAVAAATMVVAVPADAAVSGGTRKDVLERVQPLGTDIKWNGRAVEALEFNCDGEEDYVIGGRAGNRFYIAVILGPLSRPSSPLTADFPIGTNEDGALCEKTPKVWVGSMDYNPAEMLGEMPAGFVQSATCNEVDLGGECVKYHIYWNVDESKIGFWK